MKNNESLWVIIVGMIVGGISYWFNEYNIMEIGGISIYWIIGVGSMFGSMLMGYKFKLKPAKSAKFISLGVMLSVLIRIIFDTAFVDSTSHNLAPFEVIIATAIAFPCALIGAYIAKLFNSGSN